MGSATEIADQCISELIVHILKYCIPVRGNFCGGFISRISRVSPREHFHFNMSIIVMKTSTNRKIKLSWISPLSPKSQKYLCAKYIAYTVLRADECVYTHVG